MKCDGCGCQFPAREARTDTRNEPFKPAGRMPYTKIVAMTLCPGCVASRAATQRFVFWTVVLLLVGGIVLVAVVGMLASLLG